MTAVSYPATQAFPGALVSSAIHDTHEVPKAHAARVAVISDAAPTRNGVGTYYTDLLAQLAPVCERVHLFAPDSRTSGWYRYVGVPLPGDKTQRVCLPRPRKLRDIRHMRPTVIVVPTPGPFGMMGLWMARRLNVPLVCGFHTHYEAIADMYWRRGFGRISQSYLNRCNRLLFRHSALVLGNSPEMVSQAEAIGARRTALMGTCIGTSFLNRARRPLPEHGPGRVLFAGRLAAEKNLHKILQCAERLPDLRFTIAGDGPLRGDVERAARSLGNLDYVGWVARDTLCTLIDEHDVMTLLSHVESFGTVALEAMSRGRPVVVSERCGITQWPMLANGLIVVGKDQHPAGALRHWFSRPYQARERLSASAYTASRALNRHTLQQWAEWLADPYRADV